MAEEGPLINVNAAWRQVERTSKRTGKVSRKNYKVDFQIQDLIVDTDARALNSEFSELVKEVVKQEMQGISEVASLATRQRRQRAERDRQSGWYRKRYSGGRTGETVPNQSVRLFNDSNRMSNNLTLRARINSAGQSVITMNVPANRLDPRTFGSAGAFNEMQRKLRSLVPILDSKTTPVSNRFLEKGMRDLLEGLVASGKARHEALLRKRRRQFLAAARAAGGFFG